MNSDASRFRACARGTRAVDRRDPNAPLGFAGNGAQPREETFAEPEQRKGRNKSDDRDRIAGKGKTPDRTRANDSYKSEKNPRSPDQERRSLDKEQ